MRILKFDLQITDLQTIEIPNSAELLAVQIKNGTPRLWALCDESEPSRHIKIVMYGTGNPIKEYPGIYIDTFQTLDGGVWHVFEDWGK